jgi:hypothetical protein
VDSFRSLDDCRFLNCSGGHGGGVYIHNCTDPISFHNCHFRDCYSVGDKGHDIRVSNLSIEESSLNSIFINCFTVYLYFSFILNGFLFLFF